MEGYNNKYGTYMTKNDKKADAIEALRKWYKEFEEAESERKIQLCTYHCTRLERILTSEYHMNEDEIWEATH